MTKLERDVRDGFHDLSVLSAGFYTHCVDDAPFFDLRILRLLMPVLFHESCCAKRRELRFLLVKARTDTFMGRFFGEKTSQTDGRMGLKSPLTAHDALFRVS